MDAVEEVDASPLLPLATDAGAPQVRMTPIPEPATAAAVALGLALIGARARRAAIRGT